MPTLAERRKQVQEAGERGNGGDFIRFKVENESKILRFLFDDASTIMSHKKFYDEEQKKWLIDDACPEGKGSYKITFNCVEYDQGGKNPRRVRWEVSEYLYNEFLSPYIERVTPARDHVWEVKVRRPGTMDVSYVAFEIQGATLDTYPIPEDSGSSTSQAAAPEAAAPTYAASAPAQTPVQSAPVQTAAPATPSEGAPARKSKYFS